MKQGCGQLLFDVGPSKSSEPADHELGQNCRAKDASDSDA